MNIPSGLVRRFAGHIDVELAGGQRFTNFRAGSTNVQPGRDKVIIMPPQTIAGSLMTGMNVCTLYAVDVTPPPFNGPPYPPSGDAATDSCTVEGIAP